MSIDDGRPYTIVLDRERTVRFTMRSLLYVEQATTRKGVKGTSVPVICLWAALKTVDDAIELEEVARICDELPPDRVLDAVEPILKKTFSSMGRVRNLLPGDLIGAPLAARPAPSDSSENSGTSPPESSP